MSSLEEKLLSSYRLKGWTTAFAESCTGGDLAARLTKIPGVSDVFLGSIVVYHPSWKEKFLNVPPHLIAEKIVSEETALAMVEGLMAVSGATVGVAVTGNIEPQGGTIWMAFQKRGEKPRTSSLFLTGDRSHSIHTVGNHILNMMISL